MYNRELSVEYALKYALKPNPIFRYFYSENDSGGDCTNFISQCLLAGGAEMMYDINPWWYKRNNSGASTYHSWSFSWSIASSLYWNIMINTKDSLKGVKAKEERKAESLLPGDIIFYENFQNKIFHSAIVTDFSRGSPLISQHTQDLKNVPYLKPYSVKSMHFMSIYF